MWEATLLFLLCEVGGTATAAGTGAAGRLLPSGTGPGWLGPALAEKGGLGKACGPRSAAAGLSTPQQQAAGGDTLLGMDLKVIDSTGPHMLRDSFKELLSTSLGELDPAFRRPGQSCPCLVAACCKTRLDYTKPEQRRAGRAGCRVLFCGRSREPAAGPR
jgi:hypothetical protein